MSKGMGSIKYVRYASFTEVQGINQENINSDNLLYLYTTALEYRKGARSKLGDWLLDHMTLINLRREGHAVVSPWGCHHNI